MCWCLKVLVSKRSGHSVLKHPCSQRKNLQNVMYGTKRNSSKRMTFQKGKTVQNVWLFKT